MKTACGAVPLALLLVGLAACGPEDLADLGEDTLPDAVADASAEDATTLDAGAPDDARPRADAAPIADATIDAGEIPGVADAGNTPDAGTVDATPAPDTGAVPPATGARAETPPRTRHLYSQLQAWSSDGRYFLATDLSTGQGVVYDANTWQERARVGRRGHRWITGTHSVLTFDDQPSTGAAVFAYDVDAGQETEVVRLGHPGLRAGRSHEELDRSGRYVAVYIERARSGGSRIVTADVIGRRVAADVSIAELGCTFEPDWVGVDPTGRYLLVQSVRAGRGACSGLWTHDIQTGAPIRQITEHRNHGTTGLGPDGRPYFLTSELTHPQDNGSQGIYRYWLDTGDREVVGAPLPWGAFSHASCLGDAGEACMMSGSNEFNSPYTGQIWRLDFDGTRTVIGPHQARGCDYWGQTHATAGPGGRYAYVTHGGNCAQIRSVVVQ